MYKEILCLVISTKFDYELSIYSSTLPVMEKKCVCLFLFCMYVYNPSFLVSIFFTKLHGVSVEFLSAVCIGCVLEGKHPFRATTKQFDFDLQ